MRLPLARRSQSAIDPVIGPVNAPLRPIRLKTRLMRGPPSAGVSQVRHNSNATFEGAGSTAIVALPRKPLRQRQ